MDVTHGGGDVHARTGVPAARLAVRLRKRRAVVGRSPACRQTGAPVGAGAACGLRDNARVPGARTPPQPRRTGAVDVPGPPLPGWPEVTGREYEPGNRAHVVIDTAGRTPRSPR
ncbi:hypothetical protein [Streptomyces sp. NPDC005890]|uniref:hypothetical protein n=1 Tax=Streptomyces sp. NPDC005890 TaxID=3154568 RepID=UPI0033C5F72B